MENNMDFDNNQNDKSPFDHFDESHHLFKAINKINDNICKPLRRFSKGRKPT